MVELLCNPFFSLLFTPAKAISKFKAATELRQEGDDYRAQQYSVCKPEHFPLCNAMAAPVCYPQLMGTRSASLLWPFITA